MHLRIELEHHHHLWSATGLPVDLSVPVNPHTGLPRAWYKGPASAEPVRSDGWIGSVAEGGAVNFRDITFNPHAHGTHTETREHIHDAFQPIDARARSGRLPFIIPAFLLDCFPENHGDDWVVPLNALTANETALTTLRPSALVLRCNNGDVLRDWSDSNPPYLQKGFAERLCHLGVDHLLLDLPSVDKEMDGGALRAHNAFFGAAANPRANATISELLCIPEGVQKGPGLLAMQVAPFVNDAAPSRPAWFAAEIGAIAH
jgi:kynurenine formamidase